MLKCQSDHVPLWSICLKNKSQIHTEIIKKRTIEIWRHSTSPSLRKLLVDFLDLCCEFHENYGVLLKNYGVFAFIDGLRAHHPKIAHGEARMYRSCLRLYFWFKWIENQNIPFSKSGTRTTWSSASCQSASSNSSSISSRSSIYSNSGQYL